MEHKQVIVIRKDLKMRQGKAIAQGAHASMGAILQEARSHWISKLLALFGINLIVLDLYDGRMGPWLSGRFKKIAVYVNSEDELKEIYQKAKDKGMVCSLIEDSGLTEFNGVKTLTAVAVGPDREDIVNEVTGHLPLL